MKNTAPLVESMPVASVHAWKSIPTEEIAPGVSAGPSSPMVMKLSYS
jgi:hypothetical protein